MTAPSSRPAPGVVAQTVVSAAGVGVDALWSAVIEGRSGLRQQPLPWCDLPTWIGAVTEVESLAWPAAWQRRDCRNHRLAWLALRDAPFEQAVARAVAEHGAHRVGLVLGTSTSGMRSTELAYGTRQASGHWPEDFDFRAVHLSEASSRFVAERLGLQGPLATICTACSSSAKAFLTARRWLHSGIVDAVVVGGVDSLCLSTLHGFDSLQLLSDEPCRPFDAARRGISIGEAAGFVLLTLDEAPLQLLGGGETSDAWHMSTPHPQGEGARDAMQAALAMAGLSPQDIQHVNAHGTATPANDRSEAAALNAVFGRAGVTVASTKGVTGHTLGAAGIVEAIVALQCLARQALPPSAQLHTPDTELGLHLLQQPVFGPLRHVMSNSFGFGGSNCALVFGSAQAGVAR